MDDAHHGSVHAHVDGLSHLRQEVLLDLKAPLPNAPAAIHQEGHVHLAICKKGYSTFNNVFGNTFINNLLLVKATTLRPCSSSKCGRHLRYPVEVLTAGGGLEQCFYNAI